jgi:hypothetical protein
MTSPRSNGPMDDWNDRLKSLLDSSDMVGAIAVSRRINERIQPLHPKLEVKGIEERLAFPLLSSQADDLIRVAGETKAAGLKTDQSEETNHETIATIEAGDRHKIDASLLTFADSHVWEKILAKYCKRGCYQLGTPEARHG